MGTYFEFVESFQALHTQALHEYGLISFLLRSARLFLRLPLRLLLLPRWQCAQPNDPPNANILNKKCALESSQLTKMCSKISYTYIFDLGSKDCHPNKTDSYATLDTRVRGVLPDKGRGGLSLGIADPQCLFTENVFAS